MFFIHNIIIECYIIKEDLIIALTMSLKFPISRAVALNIKLIKHISFECKILKS